MKKIIIYIGIFIVTAALTNTLAYSESNQNQSNKPRVIVLTDIGNEPDDAQSLVRFLTYANQFEIEGLIATTSTWLRNKVNPQMIHERLDAYGQVRDNLLVHEKGCPTSEYLKKRVKTGLPKYGMKGVGDGQDSEGSDWIIKTVDEDDPRPVWVLVWGGVNSLAQSLYKVATTRTKEERNQFVDKLRVYTISDQDDSGQWIRTNFPALFYIVSLHEFSKYKSATWTGISGERHYGFEGPDFGLVSNAWLDQHIRNKGPLGMLYPQTAYIMEGDTPSFLYLINNGLNVPPRPDWGGWGGRYEYSFKHDVWTDTADTVKDATGNVHTQPQASIWRWREAYQHDFAARMIWSVTSEYEGANHNPQAALRGEKGKKPVIRNVHSGAVVKLDASGTSDPDGDNLTYNWIYYQEPGTYNGDIQIQNPSTQKTQFIAPSVSYPQTLHVILEVKDDGDPSLYSYRRIIVEVEP